MINTCSACALTLILGFFAFFSTALGCGETRGQVQSAWKPCVYVTSQKPQQSETPTAVTSYGLTRKDVDRISNGLPTIQQVTVWRSMPASINNQKQGKSIDGRVTGTTPSMAELAGVELVRGRFLTTEDGSKATAVVVIDESMAERLYPNQDPVGKTLDLDDKSFTIVGIFQDREQAPLLGERLHCVLPYSVMRREFGDQIVRRQKGGFSAESYELSGCVVEFQKVEDIEAGRKIIANLLDRSHALDDFEIHDNLPSR